MTEYEWPVCKDPHAMLNLFNFSKDSLQGRLDAPSNRKLRLIACHTGRLLENRDNNPDRTKVINACEQIADEEDSEFGIGNEGLIKARESINSIWGWVWCATSNHIVYGLRNTLHQVRGNSGSFYQQGEVANIIREVVGNPFKSKALVYSKANADDATKRGDIWILHNYITPQVLTLAQAAYEERKRKCPRWCVLPNPPIRLRGQCLEWTKGAGWHQCSVCKGAGHIDDSTLDPARLAVLSDALEEASCTNEDVLTHLRSTGPHVKGCWVLDLLLGKE